MLAGTRTAWKIRCQFSISACFAITLAFSRSGSGDEGSSDVDKATEMAGRFPKFKLRSERSEPRSEARGNGEKGKGRGKGRLLNHSRQRLDDRELMRLARDKAEMSYDEIDLSRNSLTSEAAEHILDICKGSPSLKVVKLFNNQLGDAGAETLGEIFKHCHSIEEVHLSHNNFSEEGIETMVKAATRGLPRAPRAERPLWLRMEHNKVEDSESLARDLERRYPDVCGREDRLRCTPRLCVKGRRIHLPFLIEAFKGKGKGRRSRSARRDSRRRPLRRSSRPPRRSSRRRSSRWRSPRRRPPRRRSPSRSLSPRLAKAAKLRPKAKARRDFKEDYSDYEYEYSYGYV